MSCIRFSMDGEVAGAQASWGGLGAILTNLAYLMDLVAAQRQERTPTHEAPRNEAAAHLARERGNADIAREGLVLLNRERLG